MHDGNMNIAIIEQSQNSVIGKDEIEPRHLIPLDLTTTETNCVDTMEIDEVIRKRKAETDVNHTNIVGVKKKTTKSSETDGKTDEIRLSVHELRHPSKAKKIEKHEKIDQSKTDKPYFPKERHKQIKVKPNLEMSQRKKTSQDVLQKVK